MEMMEKSVKQFGGAASIGGNGYSLKNSSRLFGIPMEDSGYFFTDETIPLYQMVVHGLIPYSGDPQNLFYDPQLQYPQNGGVRLYAVLPIHDELRRRSEGHLLQRSLQLRLQDWSAQSFSQYKEMNEKLQTVWSQPMKTHRKLQKDLYEVGYADGTRVFVNYSAGAIRHERRSSRAGQKLYRRAEGGISLAREKNPSREKENAGGLRLYRAMGARLRVVYVLSVGVFPVS